MNLARLTPASLRELVKPLLQGALFRKYVALFASVMGLALVMSSLVNIWITYREHRADLIRFQTEQAASAASKITQFIREIESQLGWMTHLSWSSTTSLEQRELDGLRLLRQVPAITEISMLDDQGREQLRLSRQAMNRVASKADFSADERFTSARDNRIFHGPVYFRRETEPYMSLAVAGARRDAGVSVAEVNLKHIWDVVNQIRVGKFGHAFVVDASGRLIAHPDLSLVLRNTDLAALRQVRIARDAAESARMSPTEVHFNVRGERVLTAHAKAEPLNWLVFVELPEQEANAPLYAAVTHSALIVLAGLITALLASYALARRMMVPIQILTAGAERIGAGALDHRIAIETDDELETLGARFNDMAAQLQASVATLERKVDERTRELQAANQSKSRFLAVASHDLRQPLHALNLLVEQLRLEQDPGRRARITGQVDAAVANMNELFNALLDISKLDAGGLTPVLADFPIQRTLDRVEATFAAMALEKGLHFSVVASSAIVRSDALLLERILLNLVSNAVRYTSEGGIVVGCRRSGDRLRIEVCDTGSGIAEDQQQAIFREFYRVPSPERHRADALGLGLAIVERLCALLDQPISLASTLGKGSRFAVSVPRLPAIDGATVLASPAPAVVDRLTDRLTDRLIVVIDDDALVREGTSGLLQSWGCRTVTGQTDAEALAGLAGRTPDLIVTDFHLASGRTGIDAVGALRNAVHSPVPACLISGDVSPARLTEAQAGGLRLLHKPVSPMALRALLSELLKDRPRA